MSPASRDNDTFDSTGKIFDPRRYPHDTSVLCDLAGPVGEYTPQHSAYVLPCFTAERCANFLDCVLAWRTRRENSTSPTHACYPTNQAFLKKLIILACFPVDLGADFFALPPAAFPAVPAALFSAPVSSPVLAFFVSVGGIRVWLVLAGCSGGS